ncbi:Isoprene synthase [Quillaja saponaria]|uniref:Isoprene synthase n=1 Tax=Quillaja saponaria TaxID=32244 RepID=A0AAD7PCY2_QUISA|nr:Isoprene synthase [Quillaja saponaria]
METFFSSVGMTYEPHLGDCRRLISVLIQVITVMDDIYDAHDDIYDSHNPLEELELFTNAIERWDRNVMDSLPNYMKICFFALNNFENEIASDILHKKGVNIIPCLMKVLRQSGIQRIYANPTRAPCHYMDFHFISNYTIPCFLFSCKSNNKGGFGFLKLVS